MRERCLSPGFRMYNGLNGARVPALPAALREVLLGGQRVDVDADHGLAEAAETLAITSGSS